MNRRAFLLTSTAIVLIVAAVGGVASTAYFLKTTATGNIITERITNASSETDIFSEFRDALENVAGAEIAAKVIKIPPPPNVAKCVFDREIAGKSFSSSLLFGQKASLYFGPYNNLHIIWLEKGEVIGKNTVYYTKLDNRQNPGDSLIAKMRVDPLLFSAPYTPAMAVDGYARMHIVSTDPDSTEKIQYTMVSVFNTSETTVEIRPKTIIDFEDPGHSYYAISMRSDRFSNLHILFVKVEGGNPYPTGIYYKKLESNLTAWKNTNGVQIRDSNFNGQLTFNTEHTIAEKEGGSDPRLLSLPDMEIDYYGKAYIIWREKADSDESSPEYFMFSKVSSDGMLEVDKKEIRLPVLGEHAYFAEYVDLYIDKKNAMHLAWDDDAAGAGSKGVYYMRLDQAGNPTLNNPKPVSEQGTISKNPVVAAWDEAFVFWEDDVRKLSYTRLDDYGNTLVSATPMSTIYGTMSVPTLTARASYHGKAHLTWMDGNNLYYARSCDVVSPPEILIESPDKPVTATQDDYVLISGKILDNTGISLAELQHPRDFCIIDSELTSTRLFVHLNGSFSHKVEDLCLGRQNQITITARDTDGNIAFTGLVISNVRSLKNGDVVYPGEKVDVSGIFPVAETDTITLSNKRNNSNPNDNTPGNSHITSEAFAFKIPQNKKPDTYYLLDRNLNLGSDYIIIEAPDAGTLKAYLGNAAGSAEDDVSRDNFRGVTLPLKEKNVTLSLSNFNIYNEVFPNAKLFFLLFHGDGGAPVEYEVTLKRGEEARVTIADFSAGYEDYMASVEIRNLPPGIMPVKYRENITFSGDTRLDATFHIGASPNAEMCKNPGCYFQGEEVSITALGSPNAEYFTRLTTAPLGIAAAAAQGSTTAGNAIDGNPTTYMIFQDSANLTLNSPHIISKLKIVSNIENPTISTSMDGETWAPITKTGEILLTAVAPYQPVTPDTVALWRFDEKSGKVAANTVQGGIGLDIYGTFSHTYGKYGSGVSFNGVDGNAFSEFPSDALALDAFTYEVWFKPEGVPSDYAELISYAVNKYGVHLQYDSNKKLYVRVGDGSDVWLAEFQGTLQMNPGNWYHVALTSNSTTLTTYINGQYDNSATYSGDIAYPSGSKVRVAEGSSGDGENLKATVDDFRIRNVPLRPIFFDNTITFERVMAKYIRIESTEENSQIFEIEPISIGMYPSTGYYSTYDGDFKDYEIPTKSATATDEGTFASKFPTYSVLNLGPFRRGLEFDGVDDYVEVTNNGKTLGLAPSYSVAAWVMPASLGTEGRIVYMDSAESSQLKYENYDLYRAADGKFAIHHEYDAMHTDYTLFTQNSYPPGEWYHVVGMFIQNDQMRIYINGELENTRNLGTKPPFASARSLIIGSRELSAHSDKSYFNGTISDVRVYNRTISNDEVVQLYNGTFIDREQLAGWWQFGETSGDALIDSSAYGNDGELVNEPKWVTLSSGYDIIEYLLGNCSAQVTTSTGASVERQFFIEQGIGLETEKISDDAIFISWNPIEYVEGANSQAYSIFGQEYRIYRNVEKCLTDTLSEDCRLPTHNISTTGFDVAATTPRGGQAYTAPLCSDQSQDYGIDMALANPLRIGCVDTGFEPSKTYTYSISAGDQLTESNALEWGTPAADVTIVEDSFSGARRGDSYIRGIVKAGQGASIEYPATGDANWNILGMDKLVFDMKVDDPSKNWNVTIYESASSGGSFHFFRIDQKDDLWHNYEFSLSELPSEIDQTDIAKIAFGSGDSFLEKSTSFGVDGLYFKNASTTRYFFSSSADGETHPTVLTPQNFRLKRAEPGCSLELSWTSQSSVKSYTIEKYEWGGGGSLQLVPGFSPAVLGTKSLHTDVMQLDESSCGNEYTYKILATRDYYQPSDTDFSNSSAIARPEDIEPGVSITAPASGTIFSYGDASFKVAAELSDSNNVTNYTVYAGQGFVYDPICSGAKGSTTAEEDYNRQLGNISPCDVDTAYLKFGQNDILVEAKDSYNNRGRKTIPVEYAPVEITMDQTVYIPELIIEMQNYEGINSTEIYCNELSTPYVILYALPKQIATPRKFNLTGCINPGFNKIRTILRVGNQTIVNNLIPGEEDLRVQSITIDEQVEYRPFNVTPPAIPITEETLMLAGHITAYQADSRLQNAVIIVDVISEVGGVARIETFSAKIREHQYSADYRLPIKLNPGPNTLNVTLKTTASKTSTISLENVVFEYIPIQITEPENTVPINVLATGSNVILINHTNTTHIDIPAADLGNTRAVRLYLRGKLSSTGDCVSGGTIINTSYHTNHTFWNTTPAGTGNTPEENVSLRVGGIPSLPNYALKQFYVDEEVYLQKLITSASIKLFGRQGDCTVPAGTTTHYILVNGNQIEISCKDFSATFDWVEFPIEDLSHLWSGPNSVEVRATEFNTGGDFIALGINTSTQNTSEIFDVLYLDDPGTDPDSVQKEGELMAALVIEYDITQNTHQLRINEEIININDTGAPTGPLTVTTNIQNENDINKTLILSSDDAPVVAEFNLGHMKINHDSKAKIYVFGERFERYSFCFLNPPEETTYIEINGREDQRIYFSPCNQSLFPPTWSSFAGWVPFEISAGLLTSEYNTIKIGSIEPSPSILGPHAGTYIGENESVPLIYLELDSPRMTTISFDACDPGITADKIGLADTGDPKVIQFDSTTDLYPGAFRDGNKISLTPLDIETGYAPRLLIGLNRTGGEIDIALNLTTVEDDRDIENTPRPTIQGIVTDPDFVGPLEVRVYEECTSPSECPEWDTSLSFDGNSDYVDVDPTNNIIGQIEEGVTVSAWVYPNTTTDKYQIFLRTKPQYIYINYRGNLQKFQLSWKNSTGRQANLFSSNTYAAGQWYHVAGVLTQDSKELYVNGESVARTPIDIGFNYSFIESLFIGKHGTGVGSYFFNGNISDARIYNRPLPASEVARLYGKTLANTDGLAGWWKLDDATGSWAMDSSGQNNNGTLEGDPIWSSVFTKDGIVNTRGDGTFTYTFYHELDCGQNIISIKPLSPKVPVEQRPKVIILTRSGGC